MITEDISGMNLKLHLLTFFVAVIVNVKKKKKRDWSKLMREGAQLARAF